MPVAVNLEGASEFVLEVNDARDGISCDQADWADAQVTLADGTVISLDKLTLVGLQSGPYTTDPPFSLMYGDRPFIDLARDCDVQRTARQLNEQQTEHTLTYTDAKSGLRVRCVAIEYHDFATVEWTLYLKNTGTVDTPVIKDIEALDMYVRRGPACEFELHHQRGDSCTPNSYEPLTTPLVPDVDERFAPAGGRPTNGAWPYFNVRWGSEGVIAAIGWPGQWKARFTRDGNDLLRLRGGQELTHFTLHPGEEVRTPRVVLQFYQGDRERAQNLWRRWMIAHNLPRIDGNVPPPILTSCSGGFFPGLKCNETDELRFINTYLEHGVKLDYWWMDAGWYPCDAWPQVGTWQVDRSRFPRGLRGISDHLHSRGIKLILWFEPERVAPGTWLYDNRSQWLLGQDGGTKLLNLGNEEARAWLTDHVDTLLTDEGIDLYRQDFNIDPLNYWRACDTPDRQGMTEIRHVEAYLAYWDELRRRHPNLLIDSCASGGRRNDLETLRRAVPLLRSDYQSFQGDPSFASGNQCQTYGLSSWLPYYGQGAYYHDDRVIYAVRSHYCPAFGLCTDVRKDHTEWTTFTRLTDQWRRVAPCYLGDYYPLSPYSLAEDVWIAWQFHLPQQDRGVVHVFRRDASIYESARLRLHGLTCDARYRVNDLDRGPVAEAAGQELTDQGLVVTIDEQPGSAVIVYERND